MFDKIDRRIIFLFVAVSLSLPVALGISLRPARMKTSQAFYEVVSSLKADDFVLVAVDWEPGTKAENEPQTAVIIEHLLRKRIKFALTTLTPLAVPTMEQLPLRVIELLRKELPEQNWNYGKDWVNLGYLAGGSVSIQNIAKTKSIKTLIKTDSKSNPLEDLSAFNGIDSINDIDVLAEFTGSVGALSLWIQFFSGPKLVHGCTSISIPDAFNFFASGQLQGLLEGVAGAAYYEYLLKSEFKNRSDKNIAIPINSGLSFAQLGVFAFILLGNLGFVGRFFSK